MPNFIIVSSPILSTAFIMLMMSTSPFQLSVRPVILTVSSRGGGGAKPVMQQLTKKI